MAFLAGIFCTFTNIRDPLWNNQQVSETEPKHFCQWCRCNVKPESKHCRICNRCVCDFDHHCIWLNVCVARRTYNAFLILLLSLIAACAAHGIASGFVLLRASQSLPHAWWSTTPHVAVFVIAAFSLLLCVLIVAALSHLFLLHCLLMYHRLSTYDWIVRRDDDSNFSLFSLRQRPMYQPAPIVMVQKPLEKSSASQEAVGKARLPELSDQQRGRIVDANKAQADQALPGQTVLT